MEIKELPLNDDVSQCITKLRKQSPKYIEQRKKEIKNCNHLFILKEKGYVVPGFHSSDYEYVQNKVECVCCGLTNKFKEIEEYIFYKYPLGFGYNSRTLESQMFYEIFSNAYLRDGKSFNESVINLISEEALETYHPKLLYQIAIMAKPRANNEEIFEIMKNLHSLENNQEKLRLQTIEQAEDLIQRYKNFEPTYLVKK